MLGKLLDLKKEVKIENIVISRMDDTVIVEIYTENTIQAEKLEKTLKEFVSMYRWLL